jgi:hypothetical protein
MNNIHTRVRIEHTLVDDRFLLRMIPAGISQRAEGVTTATADFEKIISKQAPVPEVYALVNEVRSSDHSQPRHCGVRPKRTEHFTTTIMARLRCAQQHSSRL